MKSALRPIHVLFFLFEICVFGDADKAETVSVIEADSVTLHTGVTEIRSSDEIEWRLNGYRIAKIIGGSSKTEGAFRVGMQLDNQTGDLMITNIKTTDSGEYKLKITTSKGSPEKTFSVSVSADAVKTVSMLVGDSVTLHTDLNQTQIYDVVQWRFKHLNSTIAKINRAAAIFSTYDSPDGRFRDRLQLDCLTGSLTIKNTTTEHSGIYEVDIIIIISGYTIHKSFAVTVSDEIKPALSVKKGDSVTLDTDLTEIHTDDLMLWMFGDSPIAKIIKAGNRFNTSDVRMKLDHQTGSLTITDTRFTDSGVYDLKIISSRRTVHKRFTVTVTVTDPGLSAGAIVAIVLGLLLLFAVAAGVAGVIYHRHKISKLKEWIYKGTVQSVMEGEPVTLNTDVTLNPDDSKVHKDDQLLWMFRSSRIAEMNRAAHSFTVHDDKPDGIFKGRLKLNDQTGFLTITNTKTTDSGLYELLIIRPGKSLIKKFSVSVFAQASDIEPVSVNEGKSVTLKTGVTDIQKYDRIQWKFGRSVRLAKIKEGTKKISPSADKIFQRRLELDHETGSLIIKNSRPTDAGIYMLYKMKGNISTKLFRVEVSDSTDNRNNPKKESVKKNNPEEVALNSVETS